MPQEFDLDHIFTYHAPDKEQQTHYQVIREAAKHLANVIVASTPPSADQTVAIRLLRECVMTANASIALKGRLYKETAVKVIQSDPAVHVPTWDEGIERWPKGWWLGEGLPCTKQRCSRNGNIEFPHPMYFTGEHHEIYCVFCAKTFLDLDPLPTNRLERRPV